MYNCQLVYVISPVHQRRFLASHDCPQGPRLTVGKDCSSYGRGVCIPPHPRPTKVIQISVRALVSHIERNRYPKQNVFGLKGLCGRLSDQQNSCHQNDMVSAQVCSARNRVILLVYPVMFTTDNSCFYKVTTLFEKNTT